MATIDNYKIVMDVQGQQAVDRLGKSLGGLGTIIAGIGLASFATGVLQMADAISDLASATGLAIGEIASFGGALEQAGGKADDASKMLASFFQQIDKAASGSEEAQKALQKVGITFNDLGNLSEKDLLAKALKSLSEMGPGAERTAAGMDVLGKAFRNIDPKVLEEAFASGDFSKAEASLKQMADLADTMAANMRTLQIAGAQVFSQLATALEPFIGKVEEGRLSLEQAEKIIKGIGIAIGLAFAAKTVATIVEIVGAVRLLTTALKGTAIAQTALVALSGPRGWAIIAAGALATTAAIVGLNKALDDTNSNVEELTGGKPATASTDTGPKRKTQFYTDQELQTRKQALTVAQQTTYQQSQQNKAAQDYQRIINSTIGMRQDEADVIKLTASLEQDAANKILDLNKQIDVERSKGRATNQGIIIELEKQKQQVTDNLTITKQLKLEELARADAIRQQVMETQALGGFLSTNFKYYEDENANRIRANVAFGRITEQEGTRQLELDRMRFDNANKLIALEVQAKQQGLQGLERERQQTVDLMGEEERRYKLAIAMVKQRYDIEDEKRKSVTGGVASAMDQIAKSMDPFNLAQQATLGLFSKIDDSIRQLVTTGRTSFGDLAKSFGQMILEMMLKQQVAKAASAATGWLDALFSNLFKAEGGPVKGGQPYIVGEKGPELFVPPSAGSIIPNNKMASASPASAMASTANNTYITNNISAIDAKSVAQLFAENRRTLFGSVQMAQKELSYGR
jgi:lambda family phage tail tape measure protein